MVTDELEKPMNESETDRFNKWTEKQVKPEDAERAKRIVLLYRMYYSITRQDVDAAARLTVAHLADGP